MTTTTSYADDLRSLVDSFEYEFCECGEDLDAHLIAPDMFSHPHLWCLAGERE